MENTFDVKVTTATGTTYTLTDCTSLASNLHGLLVWGKDKSYQVGQNCKVEIINMR